MNRAGAASAIGNATEWFDYGVYAVSLVYLTQNFFPGEAGTLLALSTFALSFWLLVAGAQSESLLKVPIHCLREVADPACTAATSMAKGPPTLRLPVCSP